MNTQNILRVCNIFLWMKEELREENKEGREEGRRKGGKEKVRKFTNQQKYLYQKQPLVRGIDAFD